MPRARPTALAPILLLLLFTPGCGEVVTGGNSAGPSIRQRTELMLATQDELESQLPQLTVATPGIPPIGTVPGGCPTVSSTADSDGDGILDDATLSYTNPPCQLTGLRGGTLAVTGAVRVVDPNFANNTGYNLTLTDLAWQFTAPSGGVSYTAVRNGSSSRLGSTNALSVSSLLTTERQRLDITAIATLDLDLDWAFTATVPGTVQVNAPLPSGSVTVNGTLRWRRSSEDWALAVATVTPLLYDATCPGPQRIKAGALALSGTVAGQDGTLSLVWSACGTDPARSWTPSGS